LYPYFSAYSIIESFRCEGRGTGPSVSAIARFREIIRCGNRGTGPSVSAIARFREIVRCGNRGIGPSVPADERFDEIIRRGAQDPVWRIILHDASVMHDEDARTELERFCNIVRHEEISLLTRSVYAEQFVLKRRSVDRVNRAERLIEQHDDGIGGQRPRKADALLLPS
jgi:hypothetical protein